MFKNLSIEACAANVTLAAILAMAWLTQTYPNQTISFITLALLLIALYAYISFFVIPEEQQPEDQEIEILDDTVFKKSIEFKDPSSTDWYKFFNKSALSQSQLGAMSYYRSSDRIFDLNRDEACIAAVSQIDFRPRNLGGASEKIVIEAGPVTIYIDGGVIDLKSTDNQTLIRTEKPQQRKSHLRLVS